MWIIFELGLCWCCFTGFFLELYVKRSRFIARSALKYRSSAKIPRSKVYSFFPKQIGRTLPIHVQKIYKQILPNKYAIVLQGSMTVTRLFLTVVSHFTPIITLLFNLVE